MFNLYVMYLISMGTLNGINDSLFGRNFEKCRKKLLYLLLDYGRDEPISNVLKDNFDKIVDSASKSNSVFIKGAGGSHVDGEILSWHHINGEPGEEVLSSILITTMNPPSFRELEYNNIKEIKFKIILIPLRKCCSNFTEVILLINRIFEDITKNKELKDFTVHKETGKRFLDGVILKPSFQGVGFDFKAFFNEK